jgi:hypothetical protein
MSGPCRNQPVPAGWSCVHARAASRCLAAATAVILLSGPGASATSAAAGPAPPDPASGRVTAITEFSLAGRIVEPHDPAPAGVQAGSRDGTVIGLEFGLLLPDRGRLAWGATLAAHGGRGYGFLSARLRCRWRPGGGERWLALSPGLAFGGSHDYRAFAGAGLVCGLDYGFSRHWAATLQFARLPVTDDPPGALTSLDLGLKVGGSTGLVTGSAWIVGSVLAVLIISSAVHSMDWQ